MNRFYKMIITRTLFGEWALIREWGRIGSPGTVREDRFETVDLAIRSARKLAEQKMRRGYKSLWGFREEQVSIKQVETEDPTL